MNKQNEGMTASGETLYERLGGTPVIEKIIAKFYQRVLSDRLIAKSLEDVDVEWLKQKQIEGFIEAAGGANLNANKQRKISYIHLPVGDNYFFRMKTHFIDTLHNLCISFSLINEIEKLLRPIGYSSDKSGKSGE